MRAVVGAWTGPCQLVLVGNIDQPTVDLANGDIVGAVLHEAAGSEASRAPPDVAHVWQDWDVPLDISELEVPSPDYYVALRNHMRTQ